MATNGESTGITVTGRGEEAIVPDIGFIALGVQSTAATVAAARESAANAATAVLGAIKSLGIESRDLQTSGLSIQANHDYSKESQPITGYTVGNSVLATVRNLAAVSEVVDAAVAAGGDSIRLNGIRFGNENETAAKEAARAAAMADAKSKASQLAQLGGVSLGAPLSISEVAPASHHEGLRMMKSAARDSSATPIETGTNVVSVEVTVRYAIAQG